MKQSSANLTNDLGNWATLGAVESKILPIQSNSPNQSRRNYARVTGIGCDGDICDLCTRPVLLLTAEGHSRVRCGDAHCRQPAAACSSWGAPRSGSEPSEEDQLARRRAAMSMTMSSIPRRPHPRTVYVHTAANKACIFMTKLSKNTRLIPLFVCLM